MSNKFNKTILSAAFMALLVAANIATAENNVDRGEGGKRKGDCGKQVTLRVDGEVLGQLTWKELSNLAAAETDVHGRIRVPVNAIHDIEHLARVRYLGCGPRSRDLSPVEYRSGHYFFMEVDDGAIRLARRPSESASPSTIARRIRAIEIESAEYADAQRRAGH